MIEVDEGFNAHRSQHRSIRHGKDVEGLRSQKVVACTKRCIENLGSPINCLNSYTRVVSVRETNGEIPETQVGAGSGVTTWESRT